jgi:hypothetical protein
VHGICCFSEHVNFQWNDDDVRFVLDQHAELDFYCASSLKQQSAGWHVTPLGHIILILSQPVFALSRLWAVWSGQTKDYEIGTLYMQIQLSVLVKYIADIVIISLKINLFLSWYSWKIAELALNMFASRG